MRISAKYFDGKSNLPHLVSLQISEQTLNLLSADQQLLRSAPLYSLRVSERLQNAPRIVTFEDGAQLEIAPNQGFNELLQHSGFHETAVTRWQHSWRAATLALLLTLVCVGIGYRWGLPAASKLIAAQIPTAWTIPLSQQTLAVIEKNWMQASQISSARQTELSQQLQRLTAEETNLPPLKLLFRHSPKIGANALALPDGTILVTDQLLQLSAQDGEVLAVLAHEVGHVAQKHGLRMTIQASFIGFLAGWYLGDVSSVLASLSGTLLEMRYSRAFEFAADEYAARLLQQQQRSPLLLASMLEKLEVAHTKKTARPSPDEPATAPKTQEEPLALGEYLSSHPDTHARITRLRALAAD